MKKPKENKKFEYGDKIFAKVKGFVYWPARVNPLPSDIKIPPNKIPIFFYGTHEVYFISPSSCWYYDEKTKAKWGKPRSRAHFNQGMDEIENNPTILQFEADPEGEKFLSQFYEFQMSNGEFNKLFIQQPNETKDSDDNDEIETVEKDVIPKSSKIETFTKVIDADDGSDSPSIDSDNLQDEDFKPAAKKIKKSMTINNVDKKSVRKPRNSTKKVERKQTVKPAKVIIKDNDLDSLSSISSASEGWQEKDAREKQELAKKLQELQEKQLKKEEETVKEVTKQRKRSENKSYKNIEKKPKLKDVIKNEEVKQTRSRRSSGKTVEDKDDSVKSRSRKSSGDIVTIKNVNDYNNVTIKDTDNECDEVTMKSYEEEEMVVEESLNERVISDKPLTESLDRNESLEELTSKCDKEIVVKLNLTDISKEMIDKYKDKKEDNKEQEPLKKSKLTADCKENVCEEPLKERKKIFEYKERKSEKPEVIDLDKVETKPFKAEVKKRTRKPNQKKEPVKKRSRILNSSDSSDAEDSVQNKKPRKSETREASKSRENSVSLDTDVKSNGDRPSEVATILSNYSNDIRSTLVLGNEDYEKCLRAFKAIHAMDIVFLDLVNSYSLMETVKKCRKYNRNDEIRKAALSVYKKFTDIYSGASPDELATAQKKLAEYRNLSQAKTNDRDVNKSNGKSLVEVPVSVNAMFNAQVTTESTANISDAVGNENTELTSPAPVEQEQMKPVVESEPVMTEEERMQKLSEELDAKANDILNKIEKNVNNLTQKSIAKIESDDEDEEAICRKIEQVPIRPDDGEDVPASIAINNVFGNKPTETSSNNLNVEVTSGGNSDSLDARIANLINSSMKSSTSSSKHSSSSASYHRNSSARSNNSASSSRNTNNQSSRNMDPPISPKRSETSVSLEPTYSSIPKVISTDSTIRSNTNSEQQLDNEIYDLLGV